MAWSTTSTPLYQNGNGRLTLWRALVIISAVIAIGAKLIGLEDIVGAFLCGVAVNQVLQHGPAWENVAFLGISLFIPGFFLVIGATMDLPAFVRSLLERLLFVVGIIGALCNGKYAATLGPILAQQFGSKIAPSSVVDHG
jgi:Kef-type K+ transport system membrane component KefB